MPPDHVTSLTGLVPDEPPTVFVHGVDSLEGSPHRVKAALLVWAAYPDGWAAGICWPWQRFRGSQLRALLTMWVRAKQVEPQEGVDYTKVPRISVSGGVDAWPALPPAYPRLDRRMWLPLHLHARRPDPTGEYLPLRTAMRELAQRR
ncbi:MAG: hypothetical protein HOV87_12170 [Catenulispora sp.]|nr:hypothetical protein [Catenulispora sp.]NUT39997.1 hypothetical protein [Thermoactinospora sp.]